MIRSRHDDDIAWQLIELHQQKRNNTFDFACFVRVPAFLTNCIEFVEKQYAGSCSNVVEQFAKSGVGFPEIAAYQGVVTYKK